MGRQLCLVDDAVFAYASGQMAPVDVAQAEEHLSRCESCCALVAETARWLHEQETNGSRLAQHLTAPHTIDVQPIFLSPGEVVGRFEILRVLGRGGMGVVYCAHDPELHRNLAVKLLRSDFSERRGLEEAKARLLREARAMARVSDPHVVTIYDVGVWRDQIFIAMELIEGPTLRTWMKRERPWREVVDVFMDAGKGLVAAHETGLVHRDFKPENVLMGKSGRPRVTDFGLARAVSLGHAPELEMRAEVVHDVSFSSLTETGGLTGTPAYMAPEQFAGSPSDARTDEFGYCVALYEALYRERPFDGGEHLASRVLAGEMRPPPAGSRVPSEVRAVLLKGLSVDPAERFLSMRALLDALRDAVAVAEVAESERGSAASSREVPSLAASRARWTRTLGVAAGALGIVLVTALVMRVSGSAAGHDSTPSLTGDVPKNPREWPEARGAEIAIVPLSPPTPLVSSAPPLVSSAPPLAAPRAHTSGGPHAAARSRTHKPGRTSRPSGGGPKLGDKVENPF